MIDNIISMRQQGKSYTAISKVIGMHRNKVAVICKENGCGVVLSERAMEAARIKGQNRTSEYTEANTYKCKNCGVEYIRDSNRSGDCGTFFCSRKCGADYRYKDHVHVVKNDMNLVYFVECKICGKMFTGRNIKTTTCSDQCYAESRNKIAYETSKAVHDATHKEIKCPECGKLFYPEYGTKKRVFCSSKCSNKYHSRISKANRRAKRRNVYVESVAVNVLFDRDRGMCQLCGKKLNKQRVVPHAMAITIDHITPISKGGEHSYKNTQLACFKCNSLKGNRTWKGGEQLLMFGT